MQMKEEMKEGICRNCGYSKEEHKMYGKADVPYCYKFEEKEVDE